MTGTHHKWEGCHVQQSRSRQISQNVVVNNLVHEDARYIVPLAYSFWIPQTLDVATGNVEEWYSNMADGCRATTGGGLSCSVEWHIIIIVIVIHTYFIMHSLHFMLYTLHYHDCIHHDTCEPLLCTCWVAIGLKLKVNLWQIRIIMADWSTLRSMYCNSQELLPYALGQVHQEWAPPSKGAPYSPVSIECTTCRTSVQLTQFHNVNILIERIIRVWMGMHVIWNMHTRGWTIAYIH